MGGWVRGRVGGSEGGWVGQRAGGWVRGRVVVVGMFENGSCVVCLGVMWVEDLWMTGGKYRVVTNKVLPGFTMVYVILKPFLVML